MALIPKENQMKEPPFTFTFFFRTGLVQSKIFTNIPFLSLKNSDLEDLCLLYALHKPPIRGKREETGNDFWELFLFKVLSASVLKCIIISHNVSFARVKISPFDYWLTDWICSTPSLHKFSQIWKYQNHVSFVIHWHNQEYIF